MKTIVIVGGGYAGFYTALGLEKRLTRNGEAEVILIDPRPYMTYQPFLPEVLAGSIEPRHALVSLRKNLRRTRVISGSVVEISHADRSVVVRPYAGDDYALKYETTRACQISPENRRQAKSSRTRKTHCDKADFLLPTSWRLFVANQ